MAKGYTQTFDIDYLETIAPVTKMNSIRVLISLIAINNWPLLQFDVKNAFLHRDLEEKIYMSTPLGFYMPNSKGKVCKLRKTLYGLKQSLRAWFEWFRSAMLKFGYKQMQADHTLFVKHMDVKLTTLIIYMNDIVVTGNDDDEVTCLKDSLAKVFESKDLRS